MKAVEVWYDGELSELSQGTFKEDEAHSISCLSEAYKACFRYSGQFSNHFGFNILDSDVHKNCFLMEVISLN